MAMLTVDLTHVLLILSIGASYEDD